MTTDVSRQMTEQMDVVSRRMKRLTEVALIHIESRRLRDELIRDAVARGHTYRAVANAAGLSHSAVHTIANKDGDKT